MYVNTIYLIDQFLRKNAVSQKSLTQLGNCNKESMHKNGALLLRLLEIHFLAGFISHYTCWRLDFLFQSDFLTQMKTIYMGTACKNCFELQHIIIIIQHNCVIFK